MTHESEPRMKVTKDIARVALEQALRRAEELLNRAEGLLKRRRRAVELRRQELERYDREGVTPASSTFKHALDSLKWMAGLRETDPEQQGVAPGMIPEHLKRAHRVEELLADRKSVV